MQAAWSLAALAALALLAAPTATAGWIDDIKRDVQPGVDYAGALAGDLARDGEAAAWAAFHESGGTAIDVADVLQGRLDEAREGSDASLAVLHAEAALCPALGWLPPLEVPRSQGDLTAIPGASGATEQLVAIAASPWGTVQGEASCRAAQLDAAIATLGLPGL